MDREITVVMILFPDNPKLLGLFLSTPLAERVACEHLLDIVLPAKEKERAEKGKRWTAAFAKRLARLDTLRQESKYHQVLLAWAELDKPPDLPDYLVETRAVERDYYHAAS